MSNDIKLTDQEKEILLFSYNRVVNEYHKTIKDEKIDYFVRLMSYNYFRPLLDDF